MKRSLCKAYRKFRASKLVVWAFIHKTHPILAHLICTRRCNLSCAYCNEYDSTSNPIPLEDMYARIDKLGALGTSIVTLSGGEPLIHPDLNAIIKRIRANGMVAGLITNGFYLDRERILQLNEAGLDYIQLSIDNLKPDKVSRKSLSIMLPKLQLMAEFGNFHVNVNSVIGGEIQSPQDSMVIAAEVEKLGISFSIGILHDVRGQLHSLNDEEKAIYETMLKRRKSTYTQVTRFQRNLLNGQPNDWHCRAGARYLYICENGLVSYCSQQRGYPGIPLLQYTMDDFHREFHTVKACAPYCTIGCVHRISVADRHFLQLAPAPKEEIGNYISSS